MEAGKQFTLYALGIGKSIDLLDFLYEMEKKRPKEAAKMAALFARVLEHGILNNKQKCRSLGNKLFEFKTRGGLRVVWFWDEGRMIICTHGFEKAQQKTPRREIEKALARKADYFDAKDNGSLVRKE